MKTTILIGGKAGQGINKISEIITKVLCEYGYHVFNYRDYASLIRGGHNFNLLTFSEKPVFSNESDFDYLIALDENTIKIHKEKLKNKKNILSFEKFIDLGKNSNLAQAAAFLKLLGINEEDILKQVLLEFDDDQTRKAVKEGYNSIESKEYLKKLKEKTINLDGNRGIVNGAINSGLDVYISYPMTPSTGVLHEIGQNKKVKVFQPESEIGGINMAIGSSFSGAKTMIGTSGGGFDLMTEGLSFLGMAELGLTIYLASRPGPSTGIPTYTSQTDLELALYSGHGEFPRIVICPGDPEECEEKTNEGIFLSEKFKVPTIILSDKHLAESGFSITEKINKPKKIKKTFPSKDFRISSYEHNKQGFTTENENLAKLNVEKRLKKMNQIEHFVKKLKTYKSYGNNQSKNLIVSWGSNKGAILDAIKENKTNAKFIHIIYVSPFSKKLVSEIKNFNPKNIFVIEQNSTGQLSRLIKLKTGYEILESNKILKYDGRPFYCDELSKIIRRKIK